MEEISFKSQEAKISNFERGFRAIHVINIGHRFGIFNALSLSLEGMTVEELAVNLMLHAPYLKVWLQTAYHFEILDCDSSNRFRLQPHLAEVLGIGPHLFDRSPATSSVSFGTASNEKTLRDNDSPLFSFIRTGKPIEAGKSPEYSCASSKATGSVYLLFLSVILPEYVHLKKMLEKGIKFLDIGCGSGNLIIELAHVFNRSVFMGIDPDIYGIERAEESASMIESDNRVAFDVMGAEDLPYKDEFELVCMSAALHEILPEARKRAVEKIHQSLKKGGHLLILDYPYPEKLEDFRDPRYNYGIIEQYFEISSGIVHLSGSGQDKLLDEAGFRNISRFDVCEGMYDFIMAEK